MQYMAVPLGLSMYVNVPSASTRMLRLVAACQEGMLLNAAAGSASRENGPPAATCKNPGVWYPLCCRSQCSREPPSNYPQASLRLNYLVSPSSTWDATRNSAKLSFMFSRRLVRMHLRKCILRKGLSHELPWACPLFVFQELPAGAGELECRYNSYIYVYSIKYIVNINTIHDI